MDQTIRRYNFTGNASGVAFHIRRPADFVLPVQAASSIPVTGGISESSVGAGLLCKAGADNYVTFKSAATSVRGDYIDPKRAIAMTRCEVPFDGVPSLTTVSAEVTGLVVLDRVAIDLATIGLQAYSSEGSEQPSITSKGLRLEGLRIDGYPVKVTLAEDFFCENDTMNKLAIAAGSGIAPELFFPASLAAAYGYCNSGGATKCTVVRKLEWENEPDPDAAIEGNSIVIPGFGKVYFGELYSTAYSRRITMVRFQLGSDDGGEGCAASGDANGGTWPPTP